MLSKGLVKLIRSLLQKKYRKQHNLFLVEGVKLVNELVFSEYKIHSVFALSDENTRQHIENEYPATVKEKITFVSEKELESISHLSSPNRILALAEIPSPKNIITDAGINLVLDGIRDPGNLGTLVRIADWYDVQQMICSEDCADIYNPKTVQATMGSLFRINIVYTDIFDYLKNSKNQKYATVLNGQSIREIKCTLPADILIGNESEGLRGGIEKLTDHHISIPRYGHAESLNAAVAGAVVMDWVREGFLVVGFWLFVVRCSFLVVGS